MPTPDAIPLAASSEPRFRSLANLPANASTARTLNLIAVWEKCGDLPEYKTQPFFRTSVLNRSIVVKHRLRANERDAFGDARSSATKIILPIDITNLRAGARSFFIGQKNYRDVLTEVFSHTDGRNRYDEDLMTALDTLPSLDPFLMRERLKKADFRPARCYFDSTSADTGRMFQFVRKEVAPLIGMSCDDAIGSMGDMSAKLATKIMANDGAEELEPLRMGMGMDRATFDEGVFCWKGFLYYKWTLLDLLPKIRPVTAEIESIRPTGRVPEDDQVFIGTVRERLIRSINSACRTVRLTLKVYDDAYADLTINGQPKAFREFLLNAPSLFYELGERLGAIQHIISFWRYRFPESSRPKVNVDELLDLLGDFEMSLNFEKLADAA